jgi:hypothetical protein
MGESKQKLGLLYRTFEVIGLLFVVGIFLAIAMPNYCGSPRSGPGWDANSCINNLHQIDAAINEWALVNGKTKGTVVTENDIKPFIKLNSKGNIPGCPSGGKYTYGKVGDRYQVSCSLSTANPPHKLP